MPAHVCRRDARAAHGPGLGAFAFDDEGVEAQSTDIIRNGLFTGFMTSRETAAVIGQPRSNGTMRADGWARIPLIRMTNVSLLPGAQTLDQVFDCDGIYMDTMLAHSILYPEFPNGLDFLCSWYLDDVVYYKGEGRNWTAGDRDPQLWEYCCKDSAFTLRIVEKQDEELRRRGMWEAYHGKEAL